MSNEVLAFGGEGGVLLPAQGAKRKVAVEALAAALPPRTRLFVLRCAFDEGGPWAGARELFRALLPALESHAPALLAKHDYELVHVLPDLKLTLGVRNPSLTDIASKEERVRNYPADRAVRIVHGLIDLLIALKARLAVPAGGESWILVALDYDCAGNITQVFLQELMRRAAAKLQFLLIPVVAAQTPPVFPAAVRCGDLPFAVIPPPRTQPPDPAEAARLASALEAEVSDDPLVSTGAIPDLVRLWQLAGRPDKTLEWRYKALHAFNTLGLYTDALRYGEPARELFKRMGGHAAGGIWGIFFKLFMCYMATNALDAAQRIAEEDVLTDSGDLAEAAPRIRLCYLMAMLHARALPVRDFATGERYLAEGLVHLERAALPPDEHCFQRVFNSNGLAMIRSFQGRHQEALALCREGYDLLEKHLEPGRHRLHKSVLLYNMAQVFTQIGEIDSAIANYTAAMQLDPNYSEYYNERGNLLLKCGRLEEAQCDYRRAIALSPPYFEVWSNLGQCCRLRGAMEEAIAAYDRSLDLQPNQPMVWVVRGQALEGLGRLAEAIDAYSAALALQPMLWPALAGRAVLFYEQGRVADCLADLDGALAIAPGEADLYQNRAIALGDLGRTEEACRDLRRYLELRSGAADQAEMEARLADWSAALAPAGR